MKKCISYILVMGLCVGVSFAKPHKPHHKPYHKVAQQIAQPTISPQPPVSDFLKSAVTYEFSGGRFGDNLIAYIHAKWLEYKYNLQLLYKPFKYSDQLMMHVHEKHYDSFVRHYQKIHKFSPTLSLEINPKGVLYNLPYFSECMEEYRKPNTGMHPMRINRDLHHYFAIDWDDEDFINMLRHTIAPRYPLNLVCPPDDCVSVAVHVRKNSGGYDDPLLQDTDEADYNPNVRYTDVGYPLKFVPDDYHIEYLRYLAHMFEGEKIYVFIFTDDPNPAVLAEKYAKGVNNERVVFDYRKGENGHTANVLEDLFSMMQFDCLIRGDSNLAIVAARLGDFKVVISPLHHKWNRTKLFIDKVNIIINKNA